MKIGIVYTSITGNTREVTTIISDTVIKYTSQCDIFEISQFPYHKIGTFDVLFLGTYTWGNGEIPQEMKGLYRAFENGSHKEIVTGVYGTGDQFYPHFCGAVDEFRDMLYVHSNLAATLKIELAPQKLDQPRIDRFVEVVVERVNDKKGITV
ncbi:flavodoxin domain-containing protein [Bacillus nitroreducens]